MTEQLRGRMRSAALMHELARRVGAENPHQFAGWFDKHTGMDTQASGKWRLNFSGERPLSPQQLQLLSRCDGDVARLHSAGPADLWQALWGDVRELWPLCRTRFSNHGPMLDDRIWSAIADEFNDEKSFGSALREFEGELLLADAYGEPLTLRHLTEAIAFYRLHQHINTVAPSDVDGVGAYRCMHMCLEDSAVRGELTTLGIGDLLANHVADMELGRLKHERSYRSAVAVDDLLGYVRNPQAFMSEDARWDALHLTWAD
ncbi:MULTISPECIES: hypothetical protein [Chromobacterium]|uniref:hypothetical protein n=1 Tax=Chromobacterium TaxID=535 RepID=UPI001887CAD9|nr:MULTISPECIES: hypothetical protein [Chromobacterium]QOZ85215.1 hypothetical protein DXT74_20240 [Chromobacterium sp. Rain0013]WON85424.1 hypothetical protein OK026_08010 [Chromobacterium haemolyticum]